MKKGLLASFMCMVGGLYGIEVSNMSPFDLYGAPYYFRKDAEIAGDIQEIPAGQTVEVRIPGWRWLQKRTFVFSLSRQDIKDHMTSSEYHLVPHVSIDAGNHFYLDLIGGSFKGFNAAQWQVIEPVKKKLGGVIQQLDEVTLGQLRGRYTRGALFPLQNLEVSVRQSTDLPYQEKKYLTSRKKHIKQTFEEWLGMTLSDEEVPTIALVGSGGGYRAMLGYVGALLGADDTGLLGVTSYMAALSGSTWALGPWLSSGWSLEEFKQRLLGKIETDITRFPLNTAGLVSELLKRVSFKQPVTAVNIYGWILGANLMSDFPDGPFKTFVHQQVARIQDGSKPMPIYTAVATKLPYEWVEFTPWEFGGDYFGGYIPVWAFGAPFVHGKMRYFTPPYPLSFILAICGSAFAARLSRIVSEIEEKIPFAPLKKALQVSTQEFTVGKHRASAARIFNWTWGMRPLPRAQQEIIKLIDAGISYNLPLEAVYRRKPDIIIVTDFSAAAPGSELRKAEHALRSRGFAVPPISYDGIADTPYSVFKDQDDPTVPVIIYFPYVENHSYSSFNPQECLGSWCGTFNFKYSRNQADELIGLWRHNITEAVDTIKEEIRLRIAAKKG